MSHKSIFFGIEAEGRWRGLRTCFIPARFIGSDEAIQMLMDYDYPHYYFGAACDYVTNQWEDIYRIVKQLNMRAVFTIEAELDMLPNIPMGLLNSDYIRIILTAPAVTTGARNMQNIEVKVQDEEHAAIFSFQHSQPLVYLKDTE